MGVSVITGLGSGDLSMGFSSSRSWWIHRSGGFRSLEFPLYLWEPLDDLEAARFLRENTGGRGERLTLVRGGGGVGEVRVRRVRRKKKEKKRVEALLLFLVGRGAPRAQEGPDHHHDDGEGPHGDDDDDDQDVTFAVASDP